MSMNEIATLVVSIAAAVISVASAVYAGALSKQLAGSDSKAVEEVKSDTARLLSALRSLMHKGALSSSVSGNVDISAEKAVIDAFVNSQTGFAYYSWVDETNSRARAAGRQNEPWRAFFLYLAELSHTSSAYQAARRAADVELLFDQLTEADLTKIAEFNTHLIQAIAKNSRNREGNVVVKALVDLQRAERAEYSSENLSAKLMYLKQLGIQDPDIDLYLAALNDDEAQQQAALQAGADPKTTDVTLLRRYATQLAAYPGGAATTP